MSLKSCQHLHSSMDRLKVTAYEKTLTDLANLHSSMDRLKGIKG